MNNIDKAAEELPRNDEFLAWVKGITRGKNTSLSDLYYWFIENVSQQAPYAAAGTGQISAKEIQLQLLEDIYEQATLTGWSDSYRIIKSKVESDESPAREGSDAVEFAQWVLDKTFGDAYHNRCMNTTNGIIKYTIAEAYTLFLNSKK